MKILIAITLFILSGCMSTPKIFHNKDNNSVIKKIAFEDLDADKNGTIDRTEFNSIPGKINTESPAWGLFLILLMVVVSTGACSFMLREKKVSVSK